LNKILLYSLITIPAILLLYGISLVTPDYSLTKGPIERYEERVLEYPKMQDDCNLDMDCLRDLQKLMLEECQRAGKCP
jgi:hypothetical protein